MALATYSDLQAEIADFLARSDLTIKIPNFIKLAESRLSQGLRAREMQDSESIALTSGSGPLPVDFEEWISVRWVGAREQDLAFVEADRPEWRFRYRPTGDPQMFTILGSTVVIRPVAAGSALLWYYQSLPALSDGSPTNWLLTKAPHIYLYTAIGEANIYMKDETRADQYLGMAKNEADKASIAADASKFKVNPNRPVDTGNGSAGG